MSLKLPPFGKYIDMLNAAGVHTKSARGFWGGVTGTGEIVVTTWTDANDGEGHFYIWTPPTNHGGLKAQWEIGNIRPGTAVRAIMLRQRAKLPIGTPGRSIATAALMPDYWRVTKLVSDAGWQALIEPA